MASSTVLTRPSSTVNPRAAKRARFADDVTTPTPSVLRSPRKASPPPTSALHRPHPLLLKPSGNALLDPLRAQSARIGGLGALARLPDELLLTLLSVLEAKALFRLQAISRYLFAASRHQALWKVHYVTQSVGTFGSWEGDWRRTYWAQFLAPSSVVTKLREDAGDETAQEDLVMPGDGITTPSVYSDVLYQPHLCAASLVDYFTTGGAMSNLPHVPANSMSPEEFAALYAEPGKPVILTGLIDHWPALSKPSPWSLDALVKRFPHTPFRAEAVTATPPIYAKYCASMERAEGSADESPLYLFDSEFVKRTHGQMGEEYEVPTVFGEDLFRVLGAERPDYRWLIMGPSRAGSSWHKDPNATSAWNAVITGSKGWILFPPEVTPPGVFVSDDEAEVTAPLSLAEWFSSYYDHALHDPSLQSSIIQGICQAGEVMYIPAGWWHLVVNLESCAAVTQNFVSITDLPRVLHFLEHKPDQVSGFKLRAGSAGSVQDDEGEESAQRLVYNRFYAALRNALPQDILEVAKAKAASLAAQDTQVSERKNGKKGAWEKLKESGVKDGHSFSLGLEDEDDMGEVPW